MITAVITLEHFGSVPNTTCNTAPANQACLQDVAIWIRCQVLQHIRLRCVLPVLYCLVLKAGKHRRRRIHHGTNFRVDRRMSLVASGPAVVLACKHPSDLPCCLFWRSIHLFACLLGFGRDIRHQTAILRTLAGVDNRLTLIGSIRYGTAFRLARTSFEWKH